MRTLLTLLLTAMLSITATLNAQTILEPGDIVFAGYITTDDNNVTQDDEISFVILKDIEAGTSVFLTDLGWTDQGVFQTTDPCGVNTGSYGDGIIQWTSSTVLYCGTQVTIRCKRALTANTGTVTAIQSTFNAPNSYLSLDGNGDQVLLFQGTISSPAFICGISINRDWDTSLDTCEFTSVKSMLPSIISGLSPAIFPDAFNAAFNCSLTIGDTLTLQSALTELVNWTKDTTTILPIPTAFQLPLNCTFSGCALPIPVINIQPSSAVFCENSTVSLTISATNGTAYQWQQFIGGIWTNCIDTIPYSGSQDSAITISNAPLTLNGAQFRCIVSGAAPPQAISATATLTVQGAPTITAQTPARAICEGLNCAFSVTASGVGLSYQWQFDNGNGWTNLTNTPPYTGANNPAIQIAGSPFSLHLTNYRCIVSGTCAPPDTSAPVFIWVNQLPNVVTQPISDSICVGENALFSITATGYTLQYRWQIDTGSGYADLTNTPPFSGVTTINLNLTAPSSTLNGARFRCIVSGVCNPPDTSAEATLTIGTIPGNLTLAAGDTTPCEGSSVQYLLSPADPTATYTWFYPGNDVSFTDSMNTALFTYGENAENGSISVQFSNYCGVSPVSLFPINVQNGDFIRDTVRICPGDSILIHGNWLGIPGDYSETFTNTAGCDSSFITTLEFHPVYQFNLQAGICPGDSLFLGGAWQQVPGIYTDTLTSENGCDSILITELITFPVYNENVQATICSGDSIFLGGGWQANDGIYTDTLISSIGCDSIVNTTLTTLFPVTGTQSLTICSNDSIFIAGSWQTQAGIYTDTLTSSLGCDSILTTTLAILLTDSTYENRIICQGDSIFAGGAWQTQNGIYSDTFSNSSGCDSIHYIQLTLLSSPVVELILPDSIVCQSGLPYSLSGGSPAGGSYGGQGITGNTFDPGLLPFGIYAIQYTYTDSSGCTATATDEITYYDCTGLEQADNAHITLMPNPATAWLEIRWTDGINDPTVYEVFDPTGKLIQRSTSNEANYRLPVGNLAEGMYILRTVGNQRTGTWKFIKR
jgi:hypothetical protein